MRVLDVRIGVRWMWGLIMAWAVRIEGRVRGGGWISWVSGSAASAILGGTGGIWLLVCGGVERREMRWVVVMLRWDVGAGFRDTGVNDDCGVISTR